MLIVLVLILGGYVGYQGVNWYIYHTNSMSEKDYKELVEKLKIKDTITIHHTDLSEEEYLTFKNIKIKNKFQDFQVLEEENNNDFIKYAIYDAENPKKVTASFWMGIDETFMYHFQLNQSVFGIDYSQFDKVDRIKLLEKNKVTNDIELLEYLVKHKNVQNHLFTAVSQMKENYVIKTFISVALPSGTIRVIDGDYQGYLFESGNIREVNILKDDKRYVFTFVGKDYFSEDDVKELLSTIVIY